MSKVDLSGAVSLFERLHPNLSSPSNMALLRRVTDDDRIRLAWPTLLRNATQKSMTDLTLSVIIEAKNIADNIKLVPQNRRAYQARMHSLLAAARELHSYFSYIPMLDDDSDACSSAREGNQQIRGLVSSLSWADHYLSTVHNAVDKQCFGRLPSSQKADPKVSFGIILCDHFNTHLKKPLYELVAVLTEVVFDWPEDGTVTAHAIARAWKRHLERPNDLEPLSTDNRSANDFG